MPWQAARLALVNASAPRWASLPICARMARKFPFSISAAMLSATSCTLPSTGQNSTPCDVTSDSKS